MAPPNAGLHLGAKQIPPFRCPDAGSLGRGARQRLRRAEVHARRLAVRAERVRSWAARPARSLPPAATRQLEHRLSAVIELMNSGRSRPGSTIAEMGWCGKDLPPARDLHKLLLAVISVLPVASASFRTCRVETEGDNFGNVVVYPPAEEIEPQLDLLAGFVEAHGARSPLLTAIVAYCGITAIHPFVDGNGRTARIVFNHMMRDAVGPRFFLPIFELAGLSRGGLIIRQREAHYFGRWEPVVDFFCNAIAALANLPPQPHLPISE